ncbi:MAG TPA: hypothetical protein PK826_09160 [Anaerolineae bacterium]|nr:hypothetical protein [Ardenticatenia bacterium]HQZ71476.1 hypothetical protein [Anaerolineae bacterium]
MRRFPQSGAFRWSGLLAVLIVAVGAIAVFNPRLSLNRMSLATPTFSLAANHIQDRGPSSASSPLPIVAGATRQYYFPIFATPNPDISAADRLEHLQRVRSHFVCNADEAVAFVKDVTHTDNWKQHVAKRTSLIQLERWQDGLEPLDPSLENSPLVWIVGFETATDLAKDSVYGWLPGDHEAVSDTRYMRIVFSEEKEVISTSADTPSYDRETGNEIFPYSGFEALPNLPSQAESQEPYFSGLCSMPSG